MVQCWGVALHFIITEFRPILTLYLAAKTYLMNVVLYDVTSDAASFEQEMKARKATWDNRTVDVSLQQYLYCVRTNSEDALYDMHDSYKGDCATIPPQIHRFDMILNLMVLITCIGFMLVMLIMLFREGIRHFGEGRYLAFSARMRETTPYKIMSTWTIVITIIVISRHLMSVAKDVSNGKYTQVKLFFELYGTQVVMLIYSAIALKAVRVTCLDVNSLESLRFKRGWTSIFMEKNEDFQDSIEKAVFKAKYNLGADLEDLVDGEDCSTYDEVVETIEPQQDESDEECIGGDAREGMLAPR